MTNQINYAIALTHLYADGEAPKRRGPKPDSKPAATKRQEMNRLAQRYRSCSLAIARALLAVLFPTDPSVQNSPRAQRPVCPGTRMASPPGQGGVCTDSPRERRAQTRSPGDGPAPSSQRDPVSEQLRSEVIGDQNGEHLHR